MIEGRKKVKRDIRVAKDRLEKGLVGEWRGGVVIDLGFDELMTDNVSGLLLLRTFGLVSGSGVWSPVRRTP